MYRINVTVNNEGEELIEKLAKKTNKSKAELIRQGIILRDYYEKQKEKGKHICVATKDDKVEKEILLS